MKKIIVYLLTMLYVTALSAQLPNGTYIPITDMAKQMQFAKLEFSGNKVKVYLGINGISLGVAQEATCTMNGSNLVIKDGNQSIEMFAYDKANDQIVYNMEASYQLLAQLGVQLGQANGKNVNSQEIVAGFKKLGIVPPVWGKEGTSYVAPTPNPTIQIISPSDGNNYAIGDIIKWSANTTNASKLQIYLKNTENPSEVYTLYDDVTIKDELGFDTKKLKGGKYVMSFQALNEETGKYDKKQIYINVCKLPTLTTPEKIVDVPLTAKACNTISFSWKPVANAQFYVVNWILKKKGEREEKGGSFTIYNTSTEITLPNFAVDGINNFRDMTFNVYACGSFCNKWVQSNTPAQFFVKVEGVPQANQAPDGSNPCKTTLEDTKLTDQDVNLIVKFLKSGGYISIINQAAAGYEKLTFDNISNTVSVGTGKKSLKEFQNLIQRDMMFAPQLKIFCIFQNGIIGLNILN